MVAQVLERPLGLRGRDGLAPVPDNLDFVDCRGFTQSEVEAGRAVRRETGAGAYFGSQRA